MLSDFELCNVHAESADIEKWFILSTKMEFIEIIEKNNHQIE